MHGEPQLWLTIAIVLLNAYTFGASCVERFVNYQTWPLLSAADFAAYHRAQQPWIIRFVVVPVALSFVLQIVLCLCKPAGVSWLIALGLLVPSAIGALSTALIQIPIHRRLNADGYSEVLIAKLLRTDWIRKAADIVRLAATVGLLRQLLAWRT
jgi:hypothetical protein